MSKSDSSDAVQRTRKPDRQVGSPGFDRTQKLAVTAVEPHHCGYCRVCNADLPALEKAYTGFYSINLKFGDRASAGVQLTNTHHLYYAGVCLRCGLENRNGYRRTLMCQHFSGHKVTQTLGDLRSACESMGVCSHEKTRAFGREFLNDWDAILRKITQGTRSPQGSRALALFASVITTCRLHGHSPLLYIRDVITLRRQGLNAPEIPDAATPIGAV